MLSCLIATLALHGPTVTLVYRPPLNKPYKFQMTSDMVQEMGPMGKSAFKMAMTMEMKAVDRKGDYTTVESKVLTAKVTAAPGSPMAGMTGNMEKSMVGKVTRMVMDSHYKPKSATGGPDPQMMQGVMGSMSSFSFPAHPIRIGESWATTLDFSKIGSAMAGRMGAGKMKVKGTLPMVSKLVASDGKYATIDMTMNGVMSMAMGAQNINTTMKGGGKFRIEIASGMLHDSTYTMDSATNFGQGAMKQHMVQTMKGL